ncbi:pectate lyase family protein [Steroidobacter agaridevorans]|uniref:pectate lyase family protein n=1 Tax=Steroidobacter agaridevorans TaxID=2695856 RepID=UPI001321A056|nr:right-handed parallel beta-helix repeat-containing protein [Steroidobacter agaridevorans]GFE85862.1 pectate lyase [Steroidobacter agaridevorans]
MTESSSQTFSNRLTARAVRLGLIASAVVASGAASFAADAAVSVIPNVKTNGITTPAGRGGAVHRVTNLNADGAGSLKACVDASGPRVCVFEVSGTIRLTGDLVLRNPKITIAGQTAPSPGIMLRGGGLNVRTSDVLVQHLHVRPGDDAGGEPAINRDGLKISGPPEAAIKNIVIDHCSFSWSIDELASAWASWDNVSITNSIFAEPLHESLHPEGAHGYGVIFGPVAGHITFANNLISGAKSRNPLSNSTNTTIVNNVIYNWTNKGIELQSHGAKTNNSIVGNVLIRGPLTTSSEQPILVRADSTKPPSGSKVFVVDNAAEGSTSDPWALVGTSFGSMSLSGYKASAPVAWPAGFTTKPTGDDVTLNYVLKYAGARPADRDPIDTRVVQNVRSRTGESINCVAPNGTARCNKNAGGWPAMAENARALTLPADPNTVTASGYTNLELWLHGMAAEVEGRSRKTPASPVLANK